MSLTDTISTITSKYFPKRDPEPRVPVFDDEPDGVGPASNGRLGLIGEPFRHLYVDHQGTWACYLMGEAPWMCIDDDYSARVIDAFAHRFASLVGLRFRVRVTGSPFDSYGWAKDLHEAHPLPVDGSGWTPESRTRLPDVEGGESFDEYLTAAQERQQDLGSRVHAVVLLVRVTTDRVDQSRLPWLLNPGVLGEKEGGMEKHRARLAMITGEVTGAGVDGRPLEPVEFSWLMHASVGLGAPVSPMLLTGSDDPEWRAHLDSYTAPVLASSDPAQSYTTVRTLRDGTQHTNYVIVLHALTLRDRDDANRHMMPWAAWSQTRDYPVEAVMQFDLIAGADRLSEAARDRNVGLSIQAHNGEHGGHTASAVQLGIDRSIELEAELTSGDRVKSVTARGHVLFAVWGDTPEDAAANAHDLTTSASSEQKITLVQAFGQHPSYRAFTPGEPFPYQTGLETEMELPMFAAGVPHAAVNAGDNREMYVGPIGGGHGLFFLDQIGGARRNMSNVMLFVCDQGGGKSSFGGYNLFTAARLGYRAVGNDPSGLWQKLCKLPEVASNSRHLDLFDCKPGTLQPSLLVLEPKPGDYETPDLFDTAVREAYQERMALTIDSFRNLLPYEMVTGQGSGDVVAELREAVGTVGGEYGMDPWDAVAQLDRQGVVGARIARLLTSAANLKGGALIFPDRSRDTDDAYITGLMEQAALTIVTMKGLSLNADPTATRADWNEDQLQAIPLLDLAARFATRVIYSDTLPKVVFNDELGLSGGAAGGSFARLLPRVTVDSRKFNACVGLLGQTPGMFFALNPQIETLAGQVWLGRMRSSVAKDALKLAGLPEGYRFEEVISRLQPGQFLVNDWEGRKPIVTVDQATWSPALLEALETNPNRGNAETWYRRTLGVRA